MKYMICKKCRESESGQTMVEFILVVAIILTLLFAFLQLAWAMAWGHYVHYATFMASRAYFAAHETKEQQLENATEVLKAFVKQKDSDKDLLNQLAPARTGDRRDISGDEPIKGSFIGTHPYAEGVGLTKRFFSWAEGVQYNFEFKLFLFPLASWLKKDQGKKISIGPKGDSTEVEWDGKIGLSSDSFLGREVTNQECRFFMQELSRLYPRGDGEDFIYDNGC